MSIIRYIAMVPVYSRSPPKPREVVGYRPHHSNTFYETPEAALDQLLLGLGTVIAVDLDDGLPHPPTDQQRFEIAERRWIRDSAEIDRLRPILGLDPVRAERTVAQLEAELVRMRAVVDAACAYVNAACAAVNRGFLVDAVADYQAPTPVPAEIRRQAMGELSEAEMQAIVQRMQAAASAG